jgi:hypothetical protein
VIELYAITDDPAPPEPPLRAVPCGDLTALCAPAQEREVTADALWRHEEIVERLMEQRDLLPVRFGTIVPDEPAAVDAVLERREELLAGLDHVRGTVELAVRAELRDPPDSDESSGDYLRAKAARAARARAIHGPLEAISRDAVVRSGPELLRAAYLVERDAVERFIALVRSVQRANTDVDVVCTGPWPPYSFSGGRRR